MREMHELPKRADFRLVDQALQENHRLYQLLIENMHDLVSLVTITGEYLYASPSHRKILGYNPKELIGSNALELFHPEDVGSIKAKLALCLAGVPSQNHTARIRHKKGHWITIEGVGVPITNKLGIPEMVMVSSRDITERRETELLLACQYAVAQILATSPSLDDAMPKILQALCTHLDDWDAGIFWEYRLDRLQQAAHWIQPALARTPTGPALIKLEADLQLSNAGRAWLNGKPVWKNRRQALPAGITSSLAQPIGVKGNTQGGVIELFSHGEPVPTPRLLAMLHAISLQIGQYTTRNQAESEKNVLFEHAILLQRVTDLLSQAIVPKEVVEVFLKQGLETVGATSGVVVILDQTSNQLELLGSNGYGGPGALQDWSRFSLASRTPVAEAVRTGRPFFFSTREEWKRRYPDLPTLDKHASWAALPLHVHDRVTGAVTLSFSERQEFTPYFKSFLTSLARQCGQALDRATIYESARRSREEVGNILESIADAFLAINSTWEFTYINQRAQDFFRSYGRDSRTFLGKNVWEVMPGTSSMEFFERAHAAMQQRKTQAFEERLAPLDVWIEFNIYPAKDGISVYFRNVTNRKLVEEAMHHQAFHDALTGLPNRILLEDRVNQAINHARRYGKKAGLIFFDLDRFKKVNDVHGHAAGDHLLKEVSLRLAESIRREDTVARLSGDEFVLLLCDISETADAIRVAKKVQENLERPIHFEKGPFKAHCSMGIALYPDSGADFESLLKSADAALYKAKAAGRNGYALHSEE